MKVIVRPGKAGNVIATNAIGGNYLAQWKRFAFPTWKRYCERHRLGLVVFDRYMVPEGCRAINKPYWQKLLIGDTLGKEMPAVRNVCFLDTDILINHTAPDVFESYDPRTIALVSRFNKLPYPMHAVLRRIAFFRHYCYDKDYPLDSYLFASMGQLYSNEGLPTQGDFATTGVFVFNVHNHSRMMRDWYLKYNYGIDTLDGGTEQVHLNYEVQKTGKTSWLDYRFQALWSFEMAWKYPFLYHFGRNDDRLIRECIEASLFTNYFLHFAGAWEGSMWKRSGILKSASSMNRFDQFAEYGKMRLTGKPKGIIKPKQ